MIPADLGAELTRAISAEVSPAGTWRPGPAPGQYATSYPFGLAAATGQPAPALAAALAAALEPLPWVSAAAVTGNGYLTVTVSPAALTRLAARISAAGPDCARTATLRGHALIAPPLPELSAAPDWPRAAAHQAAAVTARLAATASATITPTFDPQRWRLVITLPDRPVPPPPETPDHPGHATPPHTTGQPDVAAAVAYAGADAVRYALTRLLVPPAVGQIPDIPVARSLSNPGYAVAFAHADAASVGRWAADLGLTEAASASSDSPAPGGSSFTAPEAAEVALLAQLSWLGERVAGAARRNRPGELPRYLEQVAAAWLDCREQCPALPFGGAAAPRDQAQRAARLQLAAATATVLATGLDLIGITPPERL